MARMRIAVLGPSEHITAAERDHLVAELERRGHAVTVHPRGGPAPADCEALVLDTKTGLDAAALDRLDRLKFVVTTTSGYDHLDLDALAARSVSAARCPIARRDAVVETSIAMALALLRRLPLESAAVAAGRWPRDEARKLGRRLLSRLRVAVVGHGVIGRRAAAVWRSLGAEVSAHDPADPRLPPLEEHLERTDVLTLHCSLTPSSRGLVGERLLAGLRPGAIVVNTARGECVDLEALTRARHLGGVGLDVFDPEPPNGLSGVCALGNVLFSPHSAGVHDDLGRMLVEETLAALDAFAEGRSPAHPLGR